MALQPDLSGRVALVTGGGRGIGKAIALGLAQAGADVAVNYRERADTADATVALIHEMGRRAQAVRADVTIAAEVAGMLETVPCDGIRSNGLRSRRSPRGAA